MLSFVTTLLLAGSALAAPSPEPSYGKQPSCMAAGQKVSSWKVENFDYHASYIFTTPAHQNSWGYANFTLSNPALPYKPVCSAQSSQLSEFFYGDFVYDCKVPEKYAGDEATFTFSRPSGQLNINQTWACPEEGGRFWTEGGVKLKLDCADKTWKNTDWKIGQTYSRRTVTCKKVTVKAPIEKISAVL
ncbi:alternaria alternata allergen 1 domain-containing protein [Sarocladium implicatum]|nr:alternaria alternata allergen 1 domain-containing protein [Sarocladium implicatum]